MAVRRKVQVDYRVTGAKEAARDVNALAKAEGEATKAATKAGEALQGQTEKTQATSTATARAAETQKQAAQATKTAAQATRAATKVATGASAAQAQVAQATVKASLATAEAVQATQAATSATGKAVVATGHYVDAQGRLRDAKGKFIKKGREADEILKKLGKTTTTASKATDGLAKSAKGVSLSLGKIGAAAFGANQALELLGTAGRMVQGAFNFAKEGAQVRDLARAFELLGGNAQHMEAIRHNLRGAVDDEQILRFHNMARTLGLTGEQFEFITKVANSASNVLGQDVAYSLESVTTGVSRQSKLWLDNIGILVDVEGEQKKLAKSLGVAVSQLDDAQRKQAFWNGFVKEGQRIINTAPIEGYADSFNRFSAELGNATSAMKQAVSEMAGPAWDAAADALKSVREELTGIADSQRMAFLAAGKANADRIGLTRFNEVARDVEALEEELKQLIAIEEGSVVLNPWRKDHQAAFHAGVPERIHQIRLALEGLRGEETVAAETLAKNLAVTVQQWEQAFGRQRALKDVTADVFEFMNLSTVSAQTYGAQMDETFGLAVRGAKGFREALDPVLTNLKDIAGFADSIGRAAVAGVDFEDAVRAQMGAIRRADLTKAARDEANRRLGKPGKVNPKARQRRQMERNFRTAEADAMLALDMQGAEQEAEGFYHQGHGLTFGGMVGSGLQGAADMERFGAQLADVGAMGMDVLDDAFAKSADGLRYLTDTLIDSRTEMERFVEVAGPGAEAIGQSLADAAVASLLFGEGFAQGVNKAMKALLQQAAGRALFETAAGFAALAVPNPASAALHFKSAKIFGIMAAGSFLGAGLSGGLGGGSGGGESAAFESARGSGAVGGRPQGFQRTDAGGGGPTTIVINNSFARTFATEREVSRDIEAALGRNSMMRGGGLAVAGGRA